MFKNAGYSGAIFPHHQLPLALLLRFRLSETSFIEYEEKWRPLNI